MLEKTVAWLKSFKMQDKSMDFNGKDYKKLPDIFSHSLITSNL